MTELIFDNARIVNDKGVWLCLKVKDPAPARAFVYSFKGVHTAILKRFQRKRSLDANAYAWALLGKLSASLRIPKEEIYRSFIKEIGGNYEIFPIRNAAVEAFKGFWGHGRVGWIVEELGASKIPGYTNVMAYYGSSVYDTQQMSRLIDLIVEECKQQDIEVLTERELSLLKEEWGCTK